VYTIVYSPYTSINQWLIQMNETGFAQKTGSSEDKVSDVVTVHGGAVAPAVYAALVDAAAPPADAHFLPETELLFLHQLLPMPNLF
jgi:hypothetical protein